MPDVSDSFLDRIIQLHRDLGIPDSYRDACKLPLYIEPDDLVDTEPDYYRRPQKLTRAAHEAWLSMSQAARLDGLNLLLISAFRGLDYQRDLIEKKLAQGQQITDILKVIAAPGYSEHHSGRAVDLSTDNCRALEVEFEKTPAYQWLNKRARGFGFTLSFPEDNPYGITYEPWHWCFQV